MLTSVTITGADDEVDVKDLRTLSVKFPFVEWGILRSTSREGMPRYPTPEWRAKLEYKQRVVPEMRLSAHFCGQLVRDTLAGDMKWFESLPAEYDRVQLNGFSTTREVEQYLGQFGVEWIIQAKTAEMLHEVARYRTDLASASRIAALWDVSGGRGIDPGAWPSPPKGLSLGYAGGINPGNVVQVIENILTVTSEPFWIDLESGVRTDDTFDLDKAHTLLELAEPFVKR
jgi:hypothetical protein